jgi:exportin-T
MATMGPSIAHLIPQLMTSMLAHFEPSELVDFMAFIGVLVHKLQDEMFAMLDELIGPLSQRIVELLAQPVTGTDDQLQHNETKRGYLAFLNSIVGAKLQRVFLSERTCTRTRVLCRR